MKILDNWALKRAEKINKQQQEIIASKLELEAKQKEHSKNIRIVIESEIEKIAEQYAKEPTHFKIGDRVILNKFNLKFSGVNGWDGGVNSLLNHIPKEEIKNPVTMIIIDIYVNKSWANEMIDKFFDNHTREWVYEQVQTVNAWNVYIHWFNEYTKNRNYYGLYKTALFDYKCSFQPKWGLNINSFHAYDTNEYNKTWDLWEKEIKLYNITKEYAIKKKELELEFKQILENNE
jgi:co-chaperonin GroES (HSP10)